MINLYQIKEIIKNQMQNYKYFPVSIYGGKVEIFANHNKNLSKFYFPDLSLRDSTILITGSIGICLTDQNLNGQIEFQKSFDPRNNCIASFRLENVTQIIDDLYINQISDSTNDVTYAIKQIVFAMISFLPESIDQIFEETTGKFKWIDNLLIDKEGVRNSSLLSLIQYRQS
jgi:hypothetical protein